MARKRSVPPEQDDDPHTGGSTYAVEVGGELRVAGDITRQRIGPPVRGPFRRAHAGGRGKGWRKGLLWKRRDYFDWYQSYLAESALDPKPPTLADLGKAMEVSADTAGRRLRDLKPPLPWPPWDHPDIWDPDD